MIQKGPKVSLYKLGFTKAQLLALKRAVDAEYDYRHALQGQSAEAKANFGVIRRIKERVDDKVFLAVNLKE